MRVKRELSYRRKELAEPKKEARELEIEKIKKTKYFDIQIRNCHESDLYQQTYVAKTFNTRRESSSDGKDTHWGVV